VCSLPRPAWSWLLGPRLVEQRRKANAKGVGQAGDGSDRHVFPASLDSLNELERAAQSLGEDFLSPSPSHTLFSHTSPGVTHELVEVAGPHEQHGAADAW